MCNSSHRAQSQSKEKQDKLDMSNWLAVGHSLLFTDDTSSYCFRPPLLLRWISLLKVGHSMYDFFNKSNPSMVVERDDYQMKQANLTLKALSDIVSSEPSWVVFMQCSTFSGLLHCCSIAAGHQHL